MTKGRLEAFSDGVFSIVITLLILDVRLPNDASPSLETLRELLPQVVTFVLSFVIVGVYWVAHHNMLHFVRAVDRYLLWLNLTLLLTVVFIPFSASLLGRHLENPLSVIVYGANLMLVNAAGTGLWLYATARRELTHDDVPPALRLFIARLHTAPILAYAAALVVARWQIALSLVLFAAVPAFFILPNPFIDRRLRAASGGGPE
jgi:uncharacterized membrane protein